MPIRKLTKREVAAEPWQVWNAYVNLLAMERFEDLTPEQRPAHLVFWYESEVQNGGHFQYFENRGTAHLSETADALGHLGAACQQEVLRRAGELWLARARSRVETVQQFVRSALVGEFSSFDSSFHACDPSLQKCLEKHLRDHQSAFVAVV